MINYELLFLSISTLGSVHCGILNNKPNVIIILADDLGVNDVSWNNKAAPTPNLGALAREGVILENMYTLPVCTPSRAALLTGMYPFRYGFQKGFGHTAPEGLPTYLSLLPQQLRTSGYNNSALGKWHLGFCNEKYTPTSRGFNQFSGLYVGDATDILDEEEELGTLNQKGDGKGHNKNKKGVKGEKGEKGHHGNKGGGKGRPGHKEADKVKGNNKNPNRDRKRELLYSTAEYVGDAVDIIKESRNQPFFIYLSLFTKVYPTKRNLKSNKSMTELRNEKIKTMDTEVKKIVDVLKSTGQYENTVILFLSDNGAKFDNEQSNYNHPLKGFKGTLYEGGTKIPAFVHSPLLSKTGKSASGRYDGLMHMVDIYPTILALANAEIPNNLDGFNQWDSINGRSVSPRKSMVYNIDDSHLTTVLKAADNTHKFQIVVRDTQYKLLWGQVNNIHKSSRKKNEFGLNFNTEVLELYDLINDKGEKVNLARQKPDVLRELQTLGLTYYRGLQPSLFRGITGNIEVLDADKPHGGVTGWCRAVQQTTCADTESVRLVEQAGVDLVTTYFGTLNSTQSITCRTVFAA